jgi:acetyl esterase/lipase
VACAVDFAAARARERGVAHPRVVLAGHSAGAQLAAVVALRPGRFGASCPYPPARPSALIGMSGVYDLRSAEQLAFPLFDATPAAAPQRWQLADPIRAARGALRPRPLPVLLLHGLADDDVPPAGTRRFAAALRDAGHPATVRLLPGITHGTVYTAGVAGPPILRWLAAGR